MRVNVAFMLLKINWFFFFFMVECRGLVQESDNLRIDGVLWELTGQTVTGEDVDFLVSFLKEM